MKKNRLDIMKIDEDVCIRKIVRFNEKYCGDNFVA